MPVTRSPSLVTTSPARRPFQALPWSKMWPSPSHWVEACSGIAIDVVGAADAVREALLAALGVGARVEHGVHRVGAPAPALLRTVRVEALGQREARAAPDQRRASPALGVVEEVQRAQDVVGAPAAPVVVGCAMARMLPAVFTPDHRRIG